MTKPEPSELTRRGVRFWFGLSPGPRRFLKNSSKNSSNGDPGGTWDWGALGFGRLVTVCDVEIFTTASMTASATSAILSGPRWAASGGVTDSPITTAATVASAGRRAEL